MAFWKSIFGGRKVAERKADSQLGSESISTHPQTAALLEPQNSQYVESPFEMAIRSGDITAAKGLIDQGADVNAPLTRHGGTSIHCTEGNLEMLGLLISKGANVNAKDRDRTTALHLTRYSNSLEVGIAKARKLLANGAEVNAADKYGATALHTAAYNGKSELVDLLLKNGAAPNIQNENKDTPLHEAVKKNFPKIVEMLLTCGADPGIPGFFGDTPIAMASSKGFAEIAKLLARSGAPLVTGSGRALNNAIKSGDGEMLRFLIDGGADVNALDDDLPPLITAVAMQNLKMVQILLEGGADPNVKAYNGRSAHMIAGTNGSADIALMLLDFISGKREPLPPATKSVQSAPSSALDRGMDTSQPVTEISIPGHYGKHLDDWDALEPKVKSALSNTVETNRQESKKNLANAVALDIQEHSDRSLNQIASLLMKTMDEPFKKVVQGNEASFGLLSIMRSRHLVNSYYWFGRLLREMPNTPLFSIVHGDMGILSFMDLVYLVKESKLDPHWAELSSHDGILAYYWHLAVDGGCDDGLRFTENEGEACEKARNMIHHDISHHSKFLIWSVGRHMDAALASATPADRDLLPIWGNVKNQAGLLLG